MNRLILAVFPLLLLFSYRLAGQVNNSGHKVIWGKIVDDSLGFTLSSVHLWNESTRMGSISNDSGEFSITVSNQDTLVFSALGYFSNIIVVSSSLNQDIVVRLKPGKYEIGEVVVRRFRSYESFKYQVIHLDLPESKTAELKEYIKVSSIAAALEADRERAIKDKLNGFGFSTPLSKGIDRKKAFKEKISIQKKRDQVIHAKFNRVLVGEITQLEGDELSEFIAQCNFSEEYLYETDFYTIIEALHAAMIQHRQGLEKH
jgi:carboxypeptidase-like protein